jgi:hypothetical protein
MDDSQLQTVMPLYVRAFLIPIMAFAVDDFAYLSPFENEQKQIPFLALKSNG